MKRKIYDDLLNWKNTKDFGYNTNSKIKSIPLYATFLIKELIK